MEAATRSRVIGARSSSIARRLPGLPRLAWMVALVGLANLIVLLAQASSLVHSLYLNADNAAALVMPALSGHAPAGAVVNLGNHPWYEPWWFMRATVGLPGYRQLWEAAPLIVGLLGAAAVAACAWWALGRLAGLLCAVVLFAASEAQRWILYVPESHGLIVIHLAALCAALLFVQRRAFAGRLTPRALLLVGVPLVLFTGAGFTDQLLLAGGLAPLILAPLLCWWRLRTPAWRIVSLFALLTGVLSVLLALLLTHVMQDQNVVHSPFPVDFVGSEALVTGLQNLIATIAALGGGSFFGAPVSGSNLLTFAAGALTLLALAAILRALWRWSTTDPPAATDMPATTDALATTDAPAERSATQVGSRELFVAYWGSVLVVALAVFALTSVSGTTTDGRYLLGAWAAIAALLGILATAPVARAALLAGVALFGVLNLHAELASGVEPAGVGPGQRLAGAIERFATAHGASVGYGSYWDSAPVTWETHLRVKLYPVGACATPAGLCPYFNNQISSWYLPRANTSSFLLTDSRTNVPGAITGPPAGFGRPTAVDDVGEGLTVYVYDHDIAADLGG
ncbi:MAG: hypothetical protein ACLQBY_11700 [Solirubrobacteraceae bacterium]